MSTDAVARMGAALRDYVAGQEEDFTLRDYFAAKAMQSMNAREDYMDASSNLIALDAYELADAMLKARKQP